MGTIATRKILCRGVAVAMIILFCLACCCNNSHHKSRRRRRLQEETEKTPSDRLKILYIVTSVAEYDTGRRKTVSGRDRFAETLVPVVVESTESIVAAGYDLDVYLIAHYELLPHRRALLERKLPFSVTLHVWDDATPLSYVRPKEEGDTNYITNITRALARQHRYVIKDKLLDYDMFINFEDDMLIHGSHVQQYLQVTKAIERLQQDAPLNSNKIPNAPKTQDQALNHNFHGPMSRVQLERVIPGFIRVETVPHHQNHTQFQKRTRPGRIPADPTATVHPKFCCQRPTNNNNSNDNNNNDPKMPSSQDLFLWETHIRALGVRKMPLPAIPPTATELSLDWVVLLRGGNPYGLDASVLIGDYWSGRDGDFNNWTGGSAASDEDSQRPPPMESIYANNQGGYMATRQQIWQWHTRTCLGGFLPPFYEPIYPKDGMNHVVEYWSGGGSLVGRLACHLQRIIPLEPTQFSKHLLYHTSNNKQKQLKFVRGLFSQADTLLGQLHTVKKRAEQAIAGA